MRIYGKMYIKNSFIFFMRVLFLSFTYLHRQSCDCNLSLGLALGLCHMSVRRLVTWQMINVKGYLQMCILSVNNCVVLDL